MKANEFVKKHGIAEAKRVLHDARGCVGVKLWGRYEFSTDELKRLTESHELIEQYNGLFEAKELIRVSPKMTGELRELAAAITDVESCM